MQASASISRRALFAAATALPLAGAAVALPAKTDAAQFVQTMGFLDERDGPAAALHALALGLTSADLYAVMMTGEFTLLMERGSERFQITSQGRVH